ncbi:MAG: DNA polymerase III subunit gamma/tau [Anaerolineae bacterium]|nr:DNA polymerase III subunit gamma/tau [Anaerolineae bacterium]
MAAQALYRKWRSQDFAEVVGQEHVTLTLRNALREGRLSHAYLFTGPRGTGKTSTARILAKAINCLDPDLAARPCNTCSICTAITEGRQLDLIEIDAASNRGIDEIRDLREKIGFRPNEARYKVYIIDEVHMLTKEAFNALLKTLEEPPPHAIFVLATTEPDRVPETVRSRCQRFDFRRIPTGEIVEHLAAILTDEGGKAEPEALVAIARRATGSMRDAVSLLDQLLSYGDDTLTLARVERVLGLVNAQTVGKLVDCIAANDTAGGLALLNSLVAEGVELGQLVDQIVAYLRAVLFTRMARTPELLDLPQDVIPTVVRQAAAFSPAALLAAVREFTEARGALRDQVPGVPQLPIELAFLRAAVAACAPATVTPATGAPAAGAPVAAVAPAATAPVVSAAPAVHTTTAATASVSPPAPPSAPATRPAEARPAAVLPNNELRQAVQANWEPFLSMAGKRCGIPVQAALRSVKEIETAGDAVVLRFAHTFSRDLVNRPEHRSQVEALWEELLKARVQVRCALVGETVAAPVPTASSQAAPGQRSGLPQSDDDAFLDDARSLGAVVKKL